MKRNAKRIIGIGVPVVILILAVLVLLRMGKSASSDAAIDSPRSTSDTVKEDAVKTPPKASAHAAAKTSSVKAEPAPKPAATPGEESPGALESLRSEGKPLALLWLRGGKRIAGNVIETNEENLLLDTGVRQVMIPVKDVLIRTPIR